MNDPTRDTDVYKRPWSADDRPQLKARGKHFARNLLIAMFNLWCLMSVCMLSGVIPWIISIYSFFMIPVLELAFIGVVLRFRLPWYWIPVSLMPFAAFAFYLYTRMYYYYP